MAIVVEIKPGSLVMVEWPNPNIKSRITMVKPKPAWAHLGVRDFVNFSRARDISEKTVQLDPGMLVVLLEQEFCNSTRYCKLLSEEHGVLFVHSSNLHLKKLA